MIFDKKEHQSVIMNLINNAQIKGADAEFVVELKKAVAFGTMGKGDKGIGEGDEGQ